MVSILVHFTLITFISKAVFNLYFKGDELTIEEVTILNEKVHFYSIILAIRKDLLKNKTIFYSKYIYILAFFTN